MPETSSEKAISSCVTWQNTLGVFQEPWPGVSPICHFQRGEGPGDEVGPYRIDRSREKVWPIKGWFPVLLVVGLSIGLITLSFFWGSTLQKFGWECAMPSLKPLPYFRPRYVVFPTPYQTQDSISLFRPSQEVTFEKGFKFPIFIIKIHFSREDSK